MLQDWKSFWTFLPKFQKRNKMNSSLIHLNTKSECENASRNQLCFTEVMMVVCRCMLSAISRGG